MVVSGKSGEFLKVFETGKFIFQGNIPFEKKKSIEGHRLLPGIKVSRIIAFRGFDDALPQKILKRRGNRGHDFHLQVLLLQRSF